MADFERQNTTGAELRAESDFSLRGYAATFGTESKDLGGFYEIVAPSAFDKSLSDPASDVRCTYNHDANTVLGRQKNGTLTISTDNKGLKFRCQLDRNQRSHCDLHAAVKRGDVSDCSFAFTVKPSGDTFASRNGKTLRTLNSVNLIDVAAVCYPAYPGTSVSARALAEVRSMGRHVAPSRLSTEALWAATNRILGFDVRSADGRRLQWAAELERDIKRDQRIEAARAELRAADAAARDLFDADQKSKVLDWLQGALDLEYGENKYRAVDCQPDPDLGYRKSVVVARDLSSDDDDFAAWDVDDLDDDQRALRPLEVSSLKLRRRTFRKVTPSDTQWIDCKSERSILAKSEWCLRMADRDRERRMRSASGR